MSPDGLNVEREVLPTPARALVVFALLLSGVRQLRY